MRDGRGAFVIAQIPERFGNLVAETFSEEDFHDVQPLLSLRVFEQEEAPMYQRTHIISVPNSLASNDVIILVRAAFSDLLRNYTPDEEDGMSVRRARRTRDHRIVPFAHA